MLGQTLRLRLIATPGLLLLAAWDAKATLITFDDMAPGVVAGDAYASLGVAFASGRIPDDVAVGDVLVFSGRADAFLILDASAISPPNTAGSRDLDLADVLISFARPVSSVALDLDSVTTTEIGLDDVVRLLALESTGNPDEFRVLGIAEDADSSPGPLSIAPGRPFAYAIFHVTTELEVFDNLRFAAVPEPSTVVLGGVAAGLAFSTGRGPGKRRQPPAARA